MQKHFKKMPTNTFIFYFFYLLDHLSMISCVYSYLLLLQWQNYGINWPWSPLVPMILLLSPPFSRRLPLTSSSYLMYINQLFGLKRPCSMWNDTHGYCFSPHVEIIPILECRGNRKQNILKITLITWLQLFTTIIPWLYFFQILIASKWGFEPGVAGWKSTAVPFELIGLIIIYTVFVITLFL